MRKRGRLRCAGCCARLRAILRTGFLRRKSLTSFFDLHFDCGMARCASLCRPKPDSKPVADRGVAEHSCGSGCRELRPTRTYGVGQVSEMKAEKNNVQRTQSIHQHALPSARIFSGCLLSLRPVAFPTNERSSR